MLRRVQVHLVDGTYELFRSFYGAPAAQVGDREVGAARTADLQSVGLRKRRATGVCTAAARRGAPPADAGLGHWRPKNLNQIKFISVFRYQNNPIE